MTGIAKTLSVFLAICFFLITCFVLSCNRKEPVPPKPPIEKVEPPKQDAQDVKDAPKPAEETPKPKTPAVPSATSLDRLNREFKTRSLNVWASKWSGRGILLNGYVESERERKGALSIARRYNPNITDMINIVTVYDNRTPAASRGHKPRPYSNPK